MDCYEILAFSDNGNRNGEVYIILATGLDKEKVDKLDFSVFRVGNQIKVILHAEDAEDAEEHIGTPETHSVFDWSKAALGCMDNDLVLHYTEMTEIIA